MSVLHHGKTQKCALTLLHSVVGQSQETKEHALCVIEGLGYMVYMPQPECKALGFQDGILPSAVWCHNIIMLFHGYPLMASHTMREMMRLLNQLPNWGEFQKRGITGFE